MFTASERVPLFDYLRVPYEPAEPGGSGPLAWVRAAEASGASLLWPARTNGSRRALLPPARYELDGIPFYAALAPDDAAERWLPRGARWRRERPVYDASGAQAGSVWRGSDGSVCLPFDPAEAVEAYLSERYLAIGARRAAQAVKRGVRRCYYLVRPALPRPVQIALRRRFSRVQARTAFPRWPIEPALDDLVALVLDAAAEVAGRPVPSIAPWPRPYSWALVLTHDVETRVGYELLGSVAELERGTGFRSSWNLVPERDYRVDPCLVASLRDGGFEVGVHGLRHDGRDFDTRRHLERRLPAMHAYAREWGAVGFRSPSTHRRFEWMELLDFLYDSSYTDTAPYEPQPGGCCSWLPYRIGRLVELPITLPQDHTLFEILGCEDETPWVEKAKFLRARGGMALMLTHPDYMTSGSLLPSYRRFLERFAADGSAWKALPHEVASWWQRRAESRLEQAGGAWKVTGPAERDAAVAWYGG